MINPHPIQDKYLLERTDTFLDYYGDIIHRSPTITYEGKGVVNVLRVCNNDTSLFGFSLLTDINPYYKKPKKLKPIRSTKPEVKKFYTPDWRK
jgi:hypothetical protein